MTNLQVDYWKLTETTRSNKESEKQRRREAREAARHNRAMEEIYRAQNAENVRHNLANEQNQQFANQTQRTTTEGNLNIGWYNAYTSRERQSLDEQRFEWEKTFESRKLDIEQQNADTNAFRAETDRYSFWVDTTKDTVQTLQSFGFLPNYRPSDKSSGVGALLKPFTILEKKGS